MYCTPDDVKIAMTEATVAQLSNDADPTTVNVAVVGSYITGASQLIDGYLRGRYKLPLTGSHAVLIRIAVDIVAWELYKRRGLQSDSVDANYKAALENLDKLQRGIITLDEGSPSERPGFYFVSERVPVFSKKLLENFL